MLSGWSINNTHISRAAQSGADSELYVLPRFFVNVNIEREAGRLFTYYCSNVQSQLPYGGYGSIADLTLYIAARK